MQRFVESGPTRLDKKGYGYQHGQDQSIVLGHVQENGGGATHSRPQNRHNQQPSRDTPGAQNQNADCNMVVGHGATPNIEAAG